MTAFGEELTAGIDIAKHIGKPIELLIERTQFRNLSAAQAEVVSTTVESLTGILEGTYDKWTSAEIEETTIMLAGGGGLATGRSIKLKWNERTLGSVRFGVILTGVTQ